MHLKTEEPKICKVGDTQIEGYSKQQSGGDASYQQFTLHFVTRTNKPFKSMGGWVNDKIMHDIREITGKDDVGVFLDFTTEDGRVIQLQTGVSLVSIEQARLNLETEMKPFGWDFDACRAHARKVWNTFWNLNQLWNLITPDVSAKWVRSLLEIYDKGGWLAKGPTGIEYSSIMVASHEIPFIVAAYQHGIRRFDVDKAFQAMVHCQTTPGQSHPGGGHVGNMHLTAYLKHGYVPIDRGYASNTLEYAYDDWCVAQLAKALNRKDRYQEFSKRSEYWRNLFDNEVGFMRARHADGRWLENSDPYSKKGGWIEGNSWQYTWFVPQNVHGLIEAMGRERFIQRLNEGLAKSEKTNFNATDDQWVLYPINHGNQPSMQVAYLFNYAGAPWLTQKWTRAIMDKYYGDDPIDG